MTNTQSELNIYCRNNKYGYKLNINHPKIKELYFRYKEWKHIPLTCRLSDKERFEFEDYVLPIIKKNSEDNPPVNKKFSD